MLWIELSHFGSAVEAIGSANFGEENTEVVDHLRLGTDGAPRVEDVIFLFEGNGGRNVLDRLHFGFGHFLEKLSRVSRKRFNVPALTLRVESVEYQRAFTAPGESRDYRNFFCRELDGEVLEVVLLHASQANVASFGWQMGGQEASSPETGVKKVYTSKRDLLGHSL